ncbi:CDP-alcohol phosphatidyltransferase family protein [Hoeflea prorocentri]|uniref:CDP-diacylglycerol--glycerol-3-phosphate 3-phosphatidyltransferase n=1 Tax=Hoeflea prorocentri TaxID=1922333 RepID=A0A9X3UG42_9HYPH|nr:CDP-alcohol phosphatidyltransferase family protein [Hoeflea prorocentri]MCY6380107.1 CDP-alcohol phosphatidyltransferase family protein [Hoeflea prorocentri]MDA5397907.1 CDP-alcohol phosphatidyltransferase family protein [Hoeflea prorocentri]
MTIPNIITVLRFLMVPAVVYSLLVGAMWPAFVIFVIAGISDAVDGFIARQFQQQTELGAYLDPIADKLLLMTVFIMLAILGHLPHWLVVMVVSRDILIIIAVILSSVMARPFDMNPIFVSKANTALQIALASVVLAELAFGTTFGDLRWLLIYGVAVLTVLSAAAYLRVWVDHMAG